MNLKDVGCCNMESETNDLNLSEWSSLDIPLAWGGKCEEIEEHKDLRAFKGAIHVVSTDMSSLSPSSRSSGCLLS